MKRLLYVLLRFLVGPLSLVQRLPFFLVCLPGAIMLLPFARTRWGHRVFYGYVTLWSGLFLWLNGIRIQAPIQQLRALEPGFFLLNYRSFIGLIVMLRVMSYKKIMLLDPASFGTGLVTYCLSVMGVCPVHRPLSIETVLTDAVYYDDYVQHHFTIIEFADMAHQTDDVIPNVMALSLRYKKPLHCLQLSGFSDVPYAHFFSPVTLSLTVVDTVPVNRRPELALLNYDHVKYQYRSET